MGGLNGGDVYTAAPELGRSRAWAVSDDGSVVVGGATDGSNENRYSAFKWTLTDGMTRIGPAVATPFEYSEAWAISADGGVIAGSYGAGGGGSEDQAMAFRWTQADGIIDMGHINDGDYTWVQGISPDGNVIVGEVEDGPGGQIKPFRWTAATGIQLLDLNGFPCGDARAASNDGSVIVGGVNSGVGDNTYAFRWTETEGVVSISSLNNGPTARAHDVSGDGTIIVGVSQDGASENAERAFRWTAETGMVSLGVLNGGNSSYAHGISTDGSVIVGWAADGNAENTSRAFRWTESSQMQTVEQWLRDNGVTVAADITKEALGTNNDGSIVVGQLSNGDAFIARVSPIGSGLMTIDDLHMSIVSAGTTNTVAHLSGGTVLNGAHSRPLSRRVSPGKNGVWIAGDWGIDEHDSRDGEAGVAEIGGGYNFGSIQANLAIGRTQSDYDLTMNGDIDYDGNYVIAETLAPLLKLSQGELWATLTAFYHLGDADITRGYLNAGVADNSRGDSDSRTWALRARLEWDKGIQFNNAAISPYVDLSYLETKIDGYTETGGGFPATFNDTKEDATELRLGLNASKPINDNINIIGLVEAVYNFDNDGVNVSGTVIGLSDFHYATESTEDIWMRAGVGVDYKTGYGKGSLMVNGTTEGEVPEIWLAASWSVEF